MAKIYGYVKTRDGNPLEGAEVYLKNDQFEDLMTSSTNSKGYYEMTCESTKAPFLAIVKDYAKDYLEFWAHDLPEAEELQIDCTIDTLELYGINAFEVKGAYPSYMIYIRPMSLKKFQAEETDIFPDLTDHSVRVFIDDEEVDVLKANVVEEGHAQGFMKGLLLQAKKPVGPKGTYRTIRVELRDQEEHLGQALLYL
ncbi:carboxypeptidase-like regulatory domain-containing protein [Guggenheimella bovis]